MADSTFRRLGSMVNPRRVRVLARCFRLVLIICFLSYYFVHRWRNRQTLQIIARCLFTGGDKSADCLQLVCVCKVQILARCSPISLKTLNQNEILHRRVVEYRAECTSMVEAYAFGQPMSVVGMWVRVPPFGMGKTPYNNTHSCRLKRESGCVRADIGRWCNGSIAVSKTVG